jgi:hypothetical protein
VNFLRFSIAALRVAADIGRDTLSRLSLLISLTLLMGNSTCPLDEQPASGTTGETSSSLDVGGTQGALWSIGTEPTLMVTLHTADGQTLSAQVDTHAGLLSLGGRSIDLESFCWRMDAVCPHQVLPNDTIIQQPRGDAQLLTSFTARGPLARLTDRAALAGQLTGHDLVVPLAVGAAATSGHCALGATSGVLATAFPSSGAEDAQRATTMRGQVTVAFSGLCVALGGNGPLLPGDYLELTATFSGKRK